MSDAARSNSPRRVRANVAPGVYLCCTSCGRLLRIVWATRSIVCSCGARLTPPKGDQAADAAKAGKPDEPERD